MKLNIRNIGGEIIKDNETYILQDNKTLKNLVLSSTLLKPNQETRGHSHDGQEEVYYFIEGRGEILLEDKYLDIQAGDIILIPDGAYHKVINTTSEYLYFICVFDGKREH